MKSNYHIKSEKGYYKLSYSGDLEEALQKAKAEAAIKAHHTKIDKLQSFIRAAEREIADRKEKDEE